MVVVVGFIFVVVGVVSPSRQRRREKRAAARAAGTAKVDASEEVAETETKEVTCEDSDEAGNIEKTALYKKGRNRSKCGGPTKGHFGPCGQKCTVALRTPEKERDLSLLGDLSLILTPGQGSREEQCKNCGAGMAPDHQCQITPDKSPDI